MFNIILFEPEIPPNTGNIIRLCANTGSALHLVKPLGFSLSDKDMKRAGLDYHEQALVRVYENFEDLLARTAFNHLYAIETCGETLYTQKQFKSNDAFLFGPETRGLPEAILEKIAKNHILKIPMQPNIRSLNLSNSVAVVVYEAWRQNDFCLVK